MTNAFTAFTAITGRPPRRKDLVRLSHLTPRLAPLAEKGQPPLVAIQALTSDRRMVALLQDLYASQGLAPWPDLRTAVTESRRRRMAQRSASRIDSSLNALIKDRDA